MAKQPKPYGEGNELVVKAWAQNSHRTVPIEAFFYRAGNASGLTNARNVQKDFYDTSSVDGTPIVVPIIAVTMPATPGASAAFSFHPADQVVQ